MEMALGGDKRPRLATAGAESMGPRQVSPRTCYRVVPCSAQRAATWEGYVPAMWPSEGQ